MYEELDVGRHQANPPALFHTLTEFPRAMLEVSHLTMMFPALSMRPKGDNHPLLLIPGFLASDLSLSMLRRYLTSLGYKAETWGFGRNTGRPEHLYDHLPEKLLEMAETYAEPVSLIGQSLGGVYARELAKEFPQATRQVITMGSPFGARNSGVAIQLVRRLVEQQSGRDVDELIELMVTKGPQVSPDVPVTAIYSKSDGVVHWRVCREAEEDHRTQNIEVNGSHCGMGFNATIYYIIADRLAQCMDNWTRFEWRTGPRH